MSFLQQLLGSSQHRQDYQDFVNRYQQGAPAEGYSDQEVANRYQQVAPQLPQQDYIQAAEAAFERMSPDERSKFGQFLQQQAQQQNIVAPNAQAATPQQLQNPGFLAQLTGQVHQQAPGLLGQLLGGGSGGGLNNTIAKAALAGITAMAAQRMMNHR